MCKKISYWAYPVLFLLTTVVLVISCNKKFDEPPVYQPPAVTPTITIKDLKASYTYGQYSQITTDDIIGGVVVANDSTGNFYKQIVIQDSTGGIIINIDNYNLFTGFPVGRMVYVKLKDLYIHDDAKLVQISGVSDGAGSFIGINSAMVSKYIIKGSLGNPLIPKVVSVSELNDSYQNMLIQLNNYSFKAADTSKTYANAVTKATVNFSLIGCNNGKAITLRTSGYASFAGVKVPGGTGSVKGIYSVFNITPQLFIRDTSDVQFTNGGCTEDTTSSNATLTSIANVRSMYSGSGVKLGSYKIGGVVISDVASKNISKGSVVLQDGDAGVSVFIGGSTVSYNVGDSIVLDITGDSLIKYAGQMEIKKSFSSTWPSPVASNKVVTPKQVTIQDLSTNLSNLEFTLVKIVGATPTATGTYSGNKTLKDASGTITLYTSSSASFSGSSLPTTSSDWVGYATFFNSTKEFMIRNLNDVVTSSGGGGGGGGNGNTVFEENFESVSTTSGNVVSLSGWKNVSESGTIKYSGATFSSNNFAKITAFKSTQATVKTWLVTPAINLDASTGETLTFETVDGFDNGATLKVYVSTDFSGSDTPWSNGTWTPLTATVSSGNASGYAASFLSSGNIDLSGYSGSVYIAFVYEGADPGKTTTFELDNVKVTGQ